MNAPPAAAPALGAALLPRLEQQQRIYCPARPVRITRIKPCARGPTPMLPGIWWARCRLSTRWGACWCTTSRTSVCRLRSKRSWGCTRWGWVGGWLWVDALQLGAAPGRAPLHAPHSLTHAPPAAAPFSAVAAGAAARHASRHAQAGGAAQRDAGHQRASQAVRRRGAGPPGGCAQRRGAAPAIGSAQAIARRLPTGVLLSLPAYPPACLHRRGARGGAVASGQPYLPRCRQALPASCLPACQLPACLPASLLVLLLIQCLVPAP